MKINERLHFFYTWESEIGPVFTIQFKKSNYSFCFCHHMKERTFPFFGLEKYFCSRCLGIIFGLLIMSLLLFFYKSLQINIFFGFLMMLPLILDGGTQFFNFRTSNNFLRFCTGILFCMGIGIIISALSS
jgi:uncharacterized membrane protein